VRQIRFSGSMREIWKRGYGSALWHRQTKEAATAPNPHSTDRRYLQQAELELGLIRINWIDKIIV